MACAEPCRCAAAGARCCGAGAEQTDGLVHRWASSPVNSKSDSESYTVNDLGNMAAGLLGSMEKAACRRPVLAPHLA